MPVYDYRCGSCSKEYHNIKNTVAERREKAPVCCGERAGIIIRPPRDAFMDYFEPYECPVTGVGVATKRQRKDIMARHNLVEGGEIRLRTVKEY
jgi:hypothetical protein